MLIFAFGLLYRRRMNSFYDHARVQKLREDMGISKQEMADALGVSLMTVYRVESGICSIDLLAKIAIVLDVPLHTLLRSAQEIAKNFSPLINIGC